MCETERTGVFLHIFSPRLSSPKREDERSRALVSLFILQLFFCFFSFLSFPPLFLFLAKISSHSLSCFSQTLIAAIFCRWCRRAGQRLGGPPARDFCGEGQHARGEDPCVPRLFPARAPFY